MVGLVCGKDIQVFGYQRGVCVVFPGTIIQSDIWFRIHGEGRSSFGSPFQNSLEPSIILEINFLVIFMTLPTFLVERSRARVKKA